MLNVSPRLIHSYNFPSGKVTDTALTSGTGVVASCTDAVNSGTETYCTETANTGSVFGSDASSREVVAV